MDKVDIIAEGSNLLAFPGNDGAVCICICVTMPDGTPVTDLQKGDFKVRQMAGTGTHSSNKVDSSLDISTQSSNFKGFYDLFVPPEKGQIWGVGEYVFAVTVKSPKGVKPPFRGQTLAKVFIPFVG